MQIKNILAATATVAGTLNPALGAVIGAVNAVLPNDKKLPMSATGGQVIDVIETLPQEQRVSLLEREIDLQIAQEEGWSMRFEAMARADGQSTRPRIALMLAQVLVFEICAFTVWAFVYPAQMGEPALWYAFGTLTGVPATVLVNYFGTLRKEQRARAAAVSGVQQIDGLAGLIQSFKKL